MTQRSEWINDFPFLSAKLSARETIYKIKILVVWSRGWTREFHVDVRRNFNALLQSHPQDPTLGGASLVHGTALRRPTWLSSLQSVNGVPGLWMNPIGKLPYFGLTFYSRNGAAPLFSFRHRCLSKTVNQYHATSFFIQHANGAPSYGTIVSAHDTRFRFPTFAERKLHVPARCCGSIDYRRQRPNFDGAGSSKTQKHWQKDMVKAVLQSKSTGAQAASTVLVAKPLIRAHCAAA
ncbi:hypothetical protein H4582DRAFT_2060839 [Lactarius indigo]|nr:hypothetical protein H4582DRAFT_2060839 [Lactarius indigo]